MRDVYIDIHNRFKRFEKALTVDIIKCRHIRLNDYPIFRFSIHKRLTLLEDIYV